SRASPASWPAEPPPAAPGPITPSSISWVRFYHRRRRRPVRQLEHEGRAAAGFTVDPDAPAMCLDDALGDEQTEPGPLLSVLLVLPEPVEHERQLLARYPRTAVGDRAAHLVIHRGDRHLDAPAGRRELE